jgi:hypothetical protein
MPRQAPSAEARALAGAARSAKVASTRPTTRPGSERTDLVVGDDVRVTLRDGCADSRGYNGRWGRVASISTQAFPSGSTYVELGVTFGKRDNIVKAQADAWFRNDELTR